MENVTTEVRAIPIAGDFTISTGGALDPKWTRLKTSTRPADRDKEGVMLEMGGGRYTDDGKTQKQKAVVEFLCDGRSEERRRGGVARRDDDDGEEKEGDGDDDEDSHEREETDDGEGGTLKFISYKDVGDDKILSLEWHTKYACEGASEGAPVGHQAKEGIGASSLGSSSCKSQSPQRLKFCARIFFPRLSEVVIYLGVLTAGCSVFLGVAAYLIFGSWINYNRYSARGWDLVPHSETIRDLPYLFKDWGRRVVSTVQGVGRGVAIVPFESSLCRYPVR